MLSGIDLIQRIVEKGAAVVSRDIYALVAVYQYLFWIDAACAADFVRC